MENILSGLKVVQGEIKSNSVNEGSQIELNGTFTLERGNFKQEYNYYGRMFETKHKNIIDVDDWNIDEEYNKVSIGDLPIDDLHKLKKTLNDSGLTTLSNSLGFSNEEQNQGMFQVMQNHKFFISHFGKKAKLWRLFSKDEQMLLDLQFVIEKFDSCGNYIKENVGKHYGIDTEVDPNDADNYIKVIPTLEVFQLKLAELSK